MKKHALMSLLLCSVLAACGQKSDQQPAQQAAAPAAAPAPAAAAPAPAADPALAKGEEVFKKTCVLCHKTGEAGAPKLGNKDEWGTRIAQGKDTLYDHAIKGFTGQKGAMPPKGGNMALADEDVKAAVDYMVAQVK